MEHFDVVIIGAGLSGIGTGAHLRTECPDKTFAILEGRERSGGTWDLFRYPGIRSDSDMFTLGYSFRPWKEQKAIPDGPAILNYIRETADEYDLDKEIRFGHRVKKAEWSSDEARWTIQVETRPVGSVPLATEDSPQRRKDAKPESSPSPAASSTSARVTTVTRAVTHPSGRALTGTRERPFIRKNGPKISITRENACSSLAVGRRPSRLYRQ